MAATATAHGCKEAELDVLQLEAPGRGVIMVTGQKIALLGRTRKHQTVTVLVSETTLTVECGDGDTRVIRRTTPRG